MGECAMGKLMLSVDSGYLESKYFSLASMGCLYPKACVKGKEATLMNLSYFHVI